MVGTYNTVRQLPLGTSILGPYHAVPDLEFLYDLTFLRDGEQVVEQQIFDRVLRMIDEAERFVLIDMFLFNSEHGGDREYIPLTNLLTDRLVEKRAQTPNVQWRLPRTRSTRSTAPTNLGISLGSRRRVSTS